MKKFSETFDKKQPTRSLMRELALAYFILGLGQIKSGTMMDRIIPHPSLKSKSPTQPFLSVSQLQILQFVAEVPSSYISLISLTLLLGAENTFITQKYK